MRYTLAAAIFTLAIAGPAGAQTEADGLKWDVNKDTVGIVSGGIGGTYIRIAADLAAVLDEKDRLRIIPMIGKGSVQNITDILYLKGTDIGIVQSDVLDHIENNALHSGIKSRVSYITKLYNEEVHVVARRDIAALGDLAGRKVNFDLVGSGTEITATIVFDALGIAVDKVSLDQPLAIEKVKSGEIAATVYVAGKPANAFAAVKPEDGLHLVPIAYEAPLQAYLPSRFEAGEYPGLVPGAPVETIAVGAVMAVFNWQPSTWRHGKVERFVQSFFARFDELLAPPRHPKWREVNLAAELPGWTRFPAAAAWLKANVDGEEAATEDAFDRFLAATDRLGDLTEKERAKLFREFLAWRRHGDGS
jgi:TRAP transporter TAXI family solute receptor